MATKNLPAVLPKDTRRYVPQPAHVTDGRRRNGGKNRWDPSDTDLTKIEQMAALTLPMNVISTVLGIHERTLERRAKVDARIGAALVKGRALSTKALHERAYQIAMRDIVETKTDRFGNTTVTNLGPCPAATKLLMFLLRAREGWIEHREDDEGGGVQSDQKVTEGNVAAVRSQARKTNARRSDT